MALIDLTKNGAAFALAGSCALAAGAAPAAEEGEAPEEAPACEYCPPHKGTWGWVSASVIRQSDDSFRFGRYTGLDEEGALPDLNGWVMHRGEDGWFYEAEGLDLGLDSRDARVEAGKQGSFRVSVEYDEIPFREDDTTVTPFRQRTATHFGLPLLWTDALSTRDMPLLLPSLREVDLETDRQRTAVEFSYKPFRKWEVRGGYSHEVKEGRTDMGATIGFDYTVTLPVPIDYETDEYDLALGYSGDRFQAELAYHGSIFDDKNQAVTWRNPFAEPDDLIGFGRIATPPDNEFHRIGVTAGYDLMEHTRLTGEFALGRMTQDDEFPPYTTNPAIPVGALTIDALVAGVGRPGARLLQRFARPRADDLDAQVDTTEAEVQIVSNPLPKLRLKASYNYSDRDNRSNRTFHRYAVTDLALSSTPRVNRPYGFQQQLVRLSAAYRLPMNSEISAGFDHDRHERTYQAVDQTTEDTYWAKLTTRPHERVDVALKYAASERDRSDYQWLHTLLMPLQNPFMRMYHLAARDRDEVAVSVSVMPLDSLTLTASAELGDEDYGDSLFGRRNADTATYTVDASFSPIETLTLNAWASREDVESDQRGAEGLLVPFWDASKEQATDTIGGGVTWRLLSDKLELSAEASYSEFDGRTDFRNNLLPALGYPDLEAERLDIRLSGEYRLEKKLSLGLAYRHEDYSESDWSRGRLGVLTLPSVLGLGAREQDYDVNLLSGYVRYDF